MRGAFHMAQARKIPASLLSPWAITDEGMRVVTQASWDSDTGPASESSAEYGQSGEVAVINVHGPLYARGNGFAGLFESMGMATTYDGIKRQLVAALDDDSVKAILLNIDSPGGEANGCGELADEIYAARSSKPITAYVSGMGASGAYWLASATERIVCAKSAELGSIGVRMALVDDRKADEAAGIKVVNFVSSQSPYKAADTENAEDCARIQARVNALAGVFIDAVAKGRGVTSEHVAENFGKGDVLIGESAVKAGLADAIGSFDSVISTIQKECRMKTILSALGLSASAGEADALAAVSALKDASAKLCELTGKPSAAESIAVAAAWKESAAQVSALKESAAKAEAARVESEFNAVLEGATKEGKIPPAADSTQRKFAESLRGKPGAVDVLRAFVAALPSLVVSETPIKEPAPANGVVVLSAEDKAMARKMGISDAKFAESKARRMKLQAEAQPDADDVA